MAPSSFLVIIVKGRHLIYIREKKINIILFIEISIKIHGDEYLTHWALDNDLQQIDWPKIRRVREAILSEF
jgi:hypothetical protein